MLNNNYYKMYNEGMKAAAKTGSASYNTNDSRYVGVTIKDVLGNNVTHAAFGLVDHLSHSLPQLITKKPITANPWSTRYSPASGGSSPYLSIALGSGTTEATPDDYNIEDIISTLSYISATYVVDTTSDVFNLKRSLVFQNTGSESISVSEICLFGRMDAVAITSYPLLYREVLTTPIIVEPNDYFTITLSADGQVIV